MNTIVWKNGIGPRERRPFLLFIKGDEITQFSGMVIPEIAVIRGTDYTKNGKWSHTTYRIEIAQGVRAITGMTGWESGRFTEGLGRAVGCRTPDTWNEIAAALSVSVPSTMRFMREFWPKAAAELDSVENELIELDSSAKGEDVEKVTVRFGSPSNRDIRDGYWDKPKVIPGYAAEIRKICVESDWTKENIDIAGMSGIVTSVEHSRGMHGGYYAVTVVVVPGTECGKAESDIRSVGVSGESYFAEALRKAMTNK